MDEDDDDDSIVADFQKDIDEGQAVLNETGGKGKTKGGKKRTKEASNAPEESSVLYQGAPQFHIPKPESDEMNEMLNMMSTKIAHAIYIVDMEDVQADLIQNVLANMFASFTLGDRQKVMAEAGFGRVTKLLQINQENETREQQEK